MKLDQVLLIDKPAGMTSFGVVARVRRVMSQAARAQGWTGKRFKVGHTGTLDPFATGLMIILTGKETRNAGNYSKLDKVYEATIELGKTSTTGDQEGEITPVIASAAKQSSEKSAGSRRVARDDEVRRVLKSFTGKITQTPPIYSAIKINGVRAYKLARQLENKPASLRAERSNPEIKIPERKVTIYNLELLEYNYPTLKIRAHVSSGTYIRTLAEDIGQTLGTGAYTVVLRRTKVGDFHIADAVALDSIIK
jgi:tRNA pseudouridine55 synthase